MGTLIEDLKKVFKGDVEGSDAVLDEYSRDASLFRVVPQAVVRPLDAKDVSRVVRFATERKQLGEDVSVTARSAGTDMSGGPLNTSIILDVTAHMNRLIELGNDYAVVEPGMYFREFDKETKKKNLELPSYTASREICAVGGMVANDAGGEKNLKYGKTARYVEELEVVLADGEVHVIRNLEGEALTKKLEEKSFEGDLYRAVTTLLKENRAVIEAGKPSVEKNSSGYAVWDIGDGVRSLNLARLMVGSQGTLGIITKIRFKLVRPEVFESMAVFFLKDIRDLDVLVPKILTHKPDSFESYDNHTFSLAVKYFPEFATQMKAGIISLGISFLPELWMLATGGIPKLVLMVEFRGDTQEETLKKVHNLITAVKELPFSGSVRIAKNERAARKYWVIRRESFNLLRQKVRGMRTAPFIDDFVVPPLSLSKFLPELSQILSKYDLIYTVAGHVGDGNFHIIPLIDPKRPDAKQIIDVLSHKVYDLVLSYRGSISGEHNDGLVRTPYVEQMFGTKMEKVFQGVKRIFDPLNIFNPGKKVGTSFADSAKYLDLPG